MPDIVAPNIPTNCERTGSACVSRSRHIRVLGVPIMHHSVFALLLIGWDIPRDRSGTLVLKVAGEGRVLYVMAATVPKKSARNPFQIV